MQNLGCLASGELKISQFCRSKLKSESFKFIFTKLQYNDSRKARRRLGEHQRCFILSSPCAGGGEPFDSRRAGGMFR